MGKFMTKKERERTNREEIKKINAAADYLNAEMEDVLAYQADIFEEPVLDEALLEVLVRVPITDADIEK